MTEAEELAKIVHDALFDLFVRDNTPDEGEEDMTDEECELVKRRTAERVLEAVQTLHPNMQADLVVKQIVTDWFEHYLFQLSPGLVKLLVQLLADEVGPGGDAWHGWWGLVYSRPQLRVACQKALLLAE